MIPYIPFEKPAGSRLLASAATVEPPPNDSFGRERGSAGNHSVAIAPNSDTCLAGENGALILAAR